jgi:transcriptional regulator with XRE-family HTH domain
VTSEISNKEFADRLKKLMAIKSIDVPRLGAKGQLKTPAIYQWLEAKYLPRGENLRKLAHVLDVSTDYLLGGEGYEGFEDRQIAVHESLSLYLKSKGVTPSHPDYEMYDRLKESAKPPVTVEEWDNLATSIIPIIQQYSRKLPVKSSSQPQKSQREVTPKRGRVVQLRKPRNHRTG